ncbi:cytochrome c-type biogenesis protein CcsB [Croceifilum oryzae]|uniref:Cytochrome c-type biogenesis protein CcsB n=1 Tax=Croceifilum oryzae TaxID=1553429 RepID=A0AAJ1WR17_9BACL|nr:c-type cytochrome biogenesis protein CcsB [Croceifilum oryzae]MDQ0418092.1 cytochrome c-type biogenesis protein CcsB [Croceifilum oryzae]
MKTTMEYFLFATFFLYLFSAVVFLVGVSGAKKKGNAERVKKWGKAGIILAIIGVTLHVAFIIIRIMLSGHFPTSNMFEFIAFLCFAVVLGFIIVFFIYRSFVLGAFVMPIAVILLSYATVFPRDVQPLIPALQSSWLYIHVTTAAIGQGLFGVSFVAGLVYLIHKVGNRDKSKSAISLELIFLVLIMFGSFSIVSTIFQMTGYQATFKHVYKGAEVVQEYKLPAIVSPYESKTVKMDSFAGMSKPLFESPKVFQGEKAASKLNSVLWSIVSGLIIYAIYFAIARKRLGKLLHPLVQKLNLELMDEIVYRSIVIGYPIFTLGALIFAMIWANQAWGRPWGWDPKETWAFITWMFYSAYLHLRLSRGWHGEKSAWLAVVGFAIILINLIVINLVISGLHSYT